MTSFPAAAAFDQNATIDDMPEGIDLPPYSLWRRVPEWEPQGRWLCDRPQIDWPDTIVSVTRAPWIFRVLLLAGLGLGQWTMPGGLPAHLTAAVLVVALWAWIEWWQRWNLAPLWRRLVAFGVQFALTAAMIVISPLSALIVWSHYMICGTFFTGPLLIAGIGTSSVLITAVQVGGYQHLGQSVALAAGLFVLDVAIGLVAIGFSNHREEAVLRRHAATRCLVVEQQRNTDLHEQLVDQARIAGIRAERARLARELHDTVAQGFVAVVTQLEAIDDDALDPEIRRRLDNAKTLGRQGLGEARRAVNALRPLALDDAGLPAALETMLGEWSRVNHVPAVISVSGDARECDGDAAIVRVVQEALSNIARHSHASRVTARLDYLTDEVVLNIHDDGAGFDPDGTAQPSHRGGRGLPGMAERLRLAGGALTVESEPGHGCVISAAVPA